MKGWICGFTLIFIIALGLYFAESLSLIESVKEKQKNKQEVAKIEIRVNDDMSQYSHLTPWKGNDTFDCGYGFYKDVFPYSLELGKTYYKYTNNGEKKLTPFIVNWVSFSQEEVICSVTIDNKTKTIEGFFNGNIFESVEDFGLWVESGNSQYIVPCGTLSNYIETYHINSVYTETNCKIQRTTYGYDYQIYPSYSFTNNGVKCHETDIRYVYYENHKLNIVCSRKYATEEECRKSVLGEMGLAQ